METIRTGGTYVAPVHVVGGFDLSQATKEDIRLGYVYGLPYRLRFTELEVFECFGLEKSRIWVHNGVKDRFEAEVREDYYTDVCITFDSPELTAKDVALLRAGGEDWGRSHPWENVEKYEREANRALTQFVTAYKQVEWFVPVSDQYYSALIDELDKPAHLRAKLAIACPKRTELPESDVLKLVHLRPAFTVEAAQVASELTEDLPPLDIQSISAQLERQRYFLFYELGLQAERYWTRGQVLPALLMAVVALEAVMRALERRGIRAGRRHAKCELVDDLVLRTNFGYRLKSCCKAFLAGDMQPSDEDLESCDKAFEIRNSLMHAKIKKNVPTIRRYTERDIYGAYAAVRRTYERLVRTLESMLDDIPA